MEHEDFEDGFLVTTVVKQSTIPGAGQGRFFVGNHKKGDVVRRQHYGKQLKIYRNAQEIEDARFDLKFLSYFGHSAPDNSPAKLQGCVCMNFPPMYTNHSRNPNVSMHYHEDEKLTVLERDVYDGEEMVQDYAEYSEVKWFEDHLVMKGVKQSIRQFGIEYNSKHNTEMTTQ